MRFLKATYFVFMITLMVACSKSPSPQQPLPEIGFTLDLDTKSAVDNSNLHVAGSQITVYDVHSRTSPSEEDQTEAGLVQYIDGEVLECDGAAWNFSPKIPWTKRGTHEFFAYYSKNGKDDSSVGATVEYESTIDGASSQTFNILPWQLTLDNQFDFMYATASRDLIHNDYSPVPLSFKHLCAAVRFKIVNTGTSANTFKEFSITGMSDSATAKIKTTGTPVIVSTVTQNAQMLVTRENGLAANGGSMFIHSNIGKVSSDGYFIMWPHSADQYDDIRFSLKMYDREIKDRLLSEVANVNNWQAGYKYTYNINVGDNFIIFESVDVVDWITDDLILEER